MPFTPTTEFKERVLKTGAQTLFSVSSSAIFNSYVDYRCTPVHCSPFSLLPSPFSLLPSPFSLLRSPFPVPRSPFPVSRFPFPVPRSPFPVPRSPFPVPRYSFSVLHSSFLVSVTSLVWRLKFSENSSEVCRLTLSESEK